MLRDEAINTDETQSRIRSHERNTGASSAKQPLRKVTA